MRNFIFFLILSTTFFFQFSCTSDKAENREQLYKEVMEVHDAVMPKMADINRIKRGLGDYINQDTIIDASSKN